MNPKNLKNPKTLVVSTLMGTLVAALGPADAFPGTCLLRALPTNSGSSKCPKPLSTMYYGSVSCDGAPAEYVPGKNPLDAAFCAYDEALSNGLSYYGAKGYKITSCSDGGLFVLTKQ
jgi:hypothetical protein